MRIGEFTEITGLSNKTARWLYDHIFHKDAVGVKQRVFTDSDVKWVLEHKVENFEAATGREIRSIDWQINYYVDNYGIIYSYKRGFLEPMTYETDSGYNRVAIDTLDGRKHFKVARIVAMVFIDNPNNYPIVNHIDGNKLNDRVDNLEWCQYQYNNVHAFKTGLAHTDSGWDDQQSRAVAMYNNSGEMLGKFGSMRQAARETGYTLAYISHQAYREVKHGTQGVYFNFI